MATEHLGRREVLLAFAGAVGMPAWAQDRAPTQLLAAWQYGAEQHIGFFNASGKQLRPGASLVVPTRAHGLVQESGGSILAVARRPGDWLLRWHPSTDKTQWQWMDEDRRLNGHVVAHPSGDRLVTTENDMESGQGLLGVRDAASLARQDEWATHGMDPHQLLVLPRALGRWPAGTLIVANGGIPTRAETGRVKQVDRMDSSLVALDPKNGKLLGQWRLDDPFLSIRHLAWDARSGRIGIALQAEHTDAEARAAAPVLAVWDGEALLPAKQQPAMKGYGGDICSAAGGGFVVSCPRADALALFDAEASFLRAVPHADAYALTAQGRDWWASGREDALHLAGADASHVAHPTQPASAWQFDNHWALATG